MQILEMTPLDMLNGIVNDPWVHDSVAPGLPPLDMTFFFRPDNLMFGDSKGVMLFENYGRGVYNAHVLFTRAVPRREVKPRILLMIGRTFTEYHARVIVASPPDANLPARIMARAAGFAPYSHSTDTLGRPCTNYILEREAWATFSAGLSQGSAAISAPKRWQTPASTQPTRH